MSINIIIVILLFCGIPIVGATDSTTLKNSIIQMTTCNENSRTDPQWNYAENINDGRGITFGCIGFCTGTYDGNVLIKDYTSVCPKNNLAKYSSALDIIDVGSHNSADGDGNPSVVGLDGFINDVENCNDPIFKIVQLYELEQMYLYPAVDMCIAAGVKNPLTLAFVYDMCVRHGTNEAQDIIDEAGSSPKQGINENEFLQKMIQIRDKKLKSEGLGDVNRDEGYLKLLNEENVNLNTPFTYNVYGNSFTIDGKISIN